MYIARWKNSDQNAGTLKAANGASLVSRKTRRGFQSIETLGIRFAKASNPPPATGTHVVAFLKVIDTQHCPPQSAVGHHRQQGEEYVGESTGPLNDRRGYRLVAKWAHDSGRSFAHAVGQDEGGLFLAVRTLPHHHP